MENSAPARGHVCTLDECRVWTDLMLQESGRGTRQHEHDGPNQSLLLLNVRETHSQTESFPHLQLVRRAFLARLCEVVRSEAAHYSQPLRK